MSDNGSQGHSDDTNSVLLVSDSEASLEIHGQAAYFT